MIPAEFQQRLRRFGGLAAVATLLFGLPLYQWFRYCMAEDLFSYAMLIPFVSGWLVWQQWKELAFEFSPATPVAGALGLLAVGLVGGSFLVSSTTEGGAVSRLGLQLLGWIAAVNAVAVWQLGAGFMRQIVFPAAFLVFMVPLPPAWVHGIEIGLQHASAEVSAWFFAWTGASFLRQGLLFQLPNITLQVAPECSGIRSTLVLFITSLIAGYLFLKNPWQRAFFSALVIPLGIARNAFRIVTIGWLCIEYGPEMIHSPIHHRGGPVFFGLSLVPLFVLLFLFRRWDKRKRAAREVTSNGANPDSPEPAGSRA
jgi:exosortase C (VPDSG-CTERM-specific)